MMRFFVIFLLTYTFQKAALAANPAPDSKSNSSGDGISFVNSAQKINQDAVAAQQISFNTDSNDKTDNASANKDETQSNSDKSKIVDSSSESSEKANALGANASDIDSLFLGKRMVSLMLNEKELQGVEKAIVAMRNNTVYESDADKKKKDSNGNIIADDTPSDRGYIHFGSMIYFGPKAWAVWLNDKKITADNNSPDQDLFVESVNKTKIKVLWKMGMTKWSVLNSNNNTNPPKLNAKNEIEIRFEIRPNQTFILTKNLVVEGDYNRNSKDQKAKSNASLAPFKKGTKPELTPIKKTSSSENISPAPASGGGLKDLLDNISKLNSGEY